MDNWIKVTDELPVSGFPVIVYVQNVYGKFTRRLRAIYVNHYSYSAWYEASEFGNETVITGDVTHWCPLPDPPKEEL